MALKNAYKYIFPAVFCGLIGFSVPADAKSISDTVAKAVQTHPDIQAVHAAQKGLKGEVREKYSGFFPVFGTEAHFGAKNVDSDNTRAAVGGDDSGYEGQASIRVSQMIYDGWNTSNSYKAAKHRYKAGGFEIKTRATNVAVDAIRAHLNVLKRRDMNAMTKKYIFDIKAYERSIGDLVEGGAADESELLQAKAVRALAENALLDFREQAAYARAEYMQLVGEWPVSELTISEQDSQSKRFIPADVPAAMDVVKKKHPLLFSARETVDALKYEVKAQEGQIMPRVNAEVGYLQKDQKEQFGGELEDASAMLRLSWNFETGGAQKARVEKRLQERQEAEMRARSIERDIERLLRQNFSKYNIAYERLSLLEKRTETNKGIFENYQVQYEGGKRSMLQLLNTRSQYQQARVQYVDAYYDFYISQFELLGAMGVLSDALDVGFMLASQKE